MVKVKYSGKSPEYLEGFPKDCKRSCKGALHLQPGSIKEITEEEWAHLKVAHPKLKLVKLEESKPLVKAKAQATMDLEAAKADESEASKVSLKKTKVKRK